MKYRKKPIEVEAFQMTPERRLDNSQWPNWLHEAWNKDRETVGSLYPRFIATQGGPLMIGTLEGNHLVSLNDYIVQGVKGELYPIKPDIFEETYDLVKDSPND